MTDVEVFKDIPGYKAILKAVLKNQIQFLVEQLSETTGEESLILTASISDGSFTDLGSYRGKTFLQKHDSLKTQFLGFCLTDNQSVKSTDVPYDKQYLAEDYRKQVTFTENHRSPSLDRIPQQTDQNGITNENPVKKKRRKSTPHKAHTNFIKSQATSQEMVPSQEDVKPVALFMKQEPGSMVDISESDSRASEFNSDRSRVVNDQPGVGEDRQEEMSDPFHTSDIPNKELPKFNDVTVNNTLDASKHKLDNQSETDSQHFHYQHSEELVSSGEQGINLVHGQSELDSLESQVQALESEMQSDPLRNRFLGDLNTLACNFCLKGFSVESDLRYHEKTCHRPKKYSCDICQKGFTRRFNMVTHRQLHFEVRQHNCKFCSKGYTRRDRLLMHYQSSHSTELGISGENMPFAQKQMSAANDST